MTYKKLIKLFLLICSIIIFSIESHIEPNENYDILGRWLSTDINKKNISFPGKGWVIYFLPNGSYQEQIDRGFGIVENCEGNYIFHKDFITIHCFNSHSTRKYNFEFIKPKLKLYYDFRDGSFFEVTFIKSNEEHPQLSKLPRLPKNKQEAIDILINKLSEKDLKEFAETSKDELIGKYHFGLGLYIRNAFGLWGTNNELIDNLSNGKAMHPDNLSSILLESLWDELQRK